MMPGYSLLTPESSAQAASEPLSNPIEVSAVEKVSSLNVRLSPRELEVLRLLTEGCSNKEIAIALHLSPNTVKTHVRSLMNKLGLGHRLQIAVFALRRNLV